MPPVTPELASLAVLALGLAGVAALVVRRSPRLAAVAWLLVVAFVPIWVSLTLVVGWSLVSSAALGVVVTLLASGRVAGGWNAGDAAVLGLCALALAPLLLGSLSISAAFGVVTVWLASWALGRLLGPVTGHRWLCSAVAVVFAVVAVLALLELATGWHGLAEWGPQNSARVTWGPIQGRGGLERSEGAFGHSIALGCSLAMAMVLTLEARFRPWVRCALVVLMLAGTVATLSRAGIACSLLGLALAAVFSRSPAVREVRRPLVAVLLVGGAGAAVLTQTVFAGAGGELEVSAAYRGDLVGLLGQVELVGPSTSMDRAADGTLYFGGFRSIDSQLLLLGLSYGWTALLPALVLLAVALVRVLTRRAGVATTAVVAQLPALATVALITQYAHLFWFVAGLAVAEAATARAGVTLTRDNGDAGLSSRDRTGTGGAG